MAETDEILSLDSLDFVGGEIPQIVVVGLAADYLFYRYKLHRERLEIRRTPQQVVVIHAHFQVAQRKEDTFIEIDIKIAPVVKVARREPSKIHPQLFKLEGVTMRTTEIRGDDFDAERVIKDIPFPLRFELSHLPAVLSQDDFDIYKKGPDKSV